MAMAALVLKMRWYNLMLYGESVVYGIYFLIILPQITVGQNTIFGLSAADGNFCTAASFSTFCWMIFNLLILELKYRSVSERYRVVFATVLNSIAFVPTVLLLMAPIHPDWQFSFLLSAAVAYRISSITATEHDMSKVGTLHTAIALSL